MYDGSWATRTHKSVNIFTAPICCHRRRNHFSGILFRTIIHKIRSHSSGCGCVLCRSATRCRLLSHRKEDKFLQAFCKLVFVLGSVTRLRSQVMNEIACEDIFYRTAQVLSPKGIQPTTAYNGSVCRYMVNGGARQLGSSRERK